MKVYKNGRKVFDGDDIAAAWNRPLPSTKCVTCDHRRVEHRREIVKQGPFDGVETHHECMKPDRRRASGECPCEKFVEPEEACYVAEDKRHEFVSDDSFYLICKHCQVRRVKEAA